MKRKGTTRKNKGGVIPIDWNAEDDGYSVLTSKKMVQFANKNNLIQTYKPFTMEKTKLYLQSLTRGHLNPHVKTFDVKK